LIIVALARYPAAPIQSLLANGIYCTVFRFN
jgi:hypothetical protein